jgi:hypothetical protein
MIKECPTCKRTYSDPTYTFCLADGALLSAPFDPYATEVLSSAVTMEPEPAPTVRAELAETLAAPSPSVSLEDEVPALEATEQVEIANAIDQTEQDSGDEKMEAAAPRRKVIVVFLGLWTIFILAAIYTQSGLPVVAALLFFGLALVLRGRSRIADQWN